MPDIAISVIIPCYNYGHFLADALEAVLHQDHQEWECIVVDDGSSDNTSEVAGAYVARDARFSCIRQKNSGLSAARNAGLAAATGKYIQLLDADDSMAAAKLGLQLAYLEAHPEADLVYGDALYFSGSGDSLSPDRSDASGGSKPVRGSACGGDLVWMLCRENIMEVSCPLIRRSLILKVGMFDREYKSFEDWQYWFRCALTGACFHYRPEPGTETYIRYGHASMMRQLRRMNEAGIQIRRFMQPRLEGSIAWYNRYRIVRLGLKKLWLSLPR